MAKIHGAVTIEQERCKGCDLCVVACPCDVLALQPKEVNDRGYHFAIHATKRHASAAPHAPWYAPTLASRFIR